ncbi:MAG: NAD(P)/FAD-dependent oxidoreductase [Prevotellaceae bacterium]|jgi:phytoene dehydrogenase-like protein|nr:NAD(P)/FAD-dependent oxidoreductase [Prevotellaceae bacterium]
MGRYDVVIVGSGLGGLECATILSKEGYNVCVLEKNELFGGCFQTYKRKDRLLDTGIHYIGSLDDGQLMNQYFRYFGIMDKLKIQRLDTEGFDQIWFQGRKYDFSMGYDNFIERMAIYFPGEHKALIDYITMLKQVASLISIDNLKKGIIAQSGMAFFLKSVTDQLSEITGNKLLQNVLTGSSLLYGGLENTSNFYYHGMVNNSYIESAYRFVDGSMQVTNELINVIRKNGGTVRKRCEVNRFVVEDDEVTAVYLSNGERVEGKNFISNIHPRQTLELLDKNQYIKKAYVSRINSLSNSYGVFTLYLLMKNGTTPYVNKNYYIHAGESIWFQGADKHSGNIDTCMVSFKPGDDKKSTDVITVMLPMYIDDLSPWIDTTAGKRGTDYEEFKQKYAQRILNHLKDRGLDYTGTIEHMYTTTPLSYRDYTGTADGSAYGIVKDFHNPQVCFVSPRTRLKNFYFTGQNMNVHGALGVTLTSMLTCAELLGHEYLAKKVGNA